VRSLLGANRTTAAHIFQQSLKLLGFTGMPPHPTESLSKRLETSLQNIDRRILITIHDQPAIGTGMRAIPQRLDHPHAIPILRIGERIIPAKAFETGKTDLSGSLFHSAKECVKSQIDSYADVLEYLTMDEFHGGASQLPEREVIQRIVFTQRLVAFLIRPLALGKQFVVDPAAFLKLLLKNTLLAFCVTDPASSDLTPLRLG